METVGDICDLIVVLEESLSTLGSCKEQRTHFKGGRNQGTVEETHTCNRLWASHIHDWKSILLARRKIMDYRYSQSINSELIDVVECIHYTPACQQPRFEEIYASNVSEDFLFREEPFDLTVVISPTASSSLIKLAMNFSASFLLMW